MLLRDMLDRYANLQRQRQQESDAIESGEHGSYEPVSYTHLTLPTIYSV